MIAGAVIFESLESMIHSKVCLADMFCGFSVLPVFRARVFSTLFPADSRVICYAIS